MSVAFIRKQDVEAAGAHLPDRPISPPPNLVTQQVITALETSLSPLLLKPNARANADGEFVEVLLETSPPSGEASTSDGIMGAINSTSGGSLGMHRRG